ncbi:MAG TPA: carboxypeptidase-like regulatory domain-containing protein [Candidatus Thermoplasmatota archaeon]
MPKIAALTEHRIGLLLAVAVLLAACLGGEPSSTSDSESLLTDETGAIAGTIVSDSLEPLGNVAISLDGAPGMAFSDDDGTFQLGLVQPGTHELGFVREDFLEATKQVQVDAGAVANLRVTLVLRPSLQSYVRIEQDTGFIGCTLTMRDPVVSPEGRAKAAMCTIVAEVGGASTLDQSQIEYPPESLDGIGDMLGEATWVSTQTLGRGLFINYWLFHPGVHATINDAWDLNWSAGPSPLGVWVPIERVHEVVAENQADCADLCNVFVLLYSSPQTATSAPVDVGLAVDQRFEMYRSTSFHDRLPSDFTALPDK